MLLDTLIAIDVSENTIAGGIVYPSPESTILYPLIAPPLIVQVILASLPSPITIIVGAIVYPTPAFIVVIPVILPLTIVAVASAIEEFLFII